MKLKTSQAEYDQYKQANEDAYSAAVVRYAERWAQLMEAELALGVALKDIAKETSHTADTEGITGFQYAAAVASLSHFWEYGEELREWHNHTHGVVGQSGVVNPCLITIE